MTDEKEDNIGEIANKESLGLNKNPSIKLIHQSCSMICPYNAGPGPSLSGRIRMQFNRLFQSLFKHTSSVRNRTNRIGTRSYSTLQVHWTGPTTTIQYKYTTQHHLYIKSFSFQLIFLHIYYLMDRSHFSFPPTLIPTREFISGFPATAA